MKRDFAALAERQFDLLVCGGGIYGAWTAYDAALRGLRVAIVEQGDWACSTSSASSKLIHGGLRYLESYDFKMVRKALSERQMLLKMAPHRVWPLRFAVPVYADSRVGTLRLKAGLVLYDLLAGGLHAGMAHRHFGRDGFSQHFPMLDSDGLRGGFTYADAQTDDARLVLELIDGALNAGAVCVNYCRVSGFVDAQGQACGATLVDQLSHATVEVRAKKIVSTIGLWTTLSAQGKAWCRLAKGIHLVLPALTGAEALLLTAKSDGRVFFIIPWYGMTLLGTTDTDYRGDIKRVLVEAQEVNYLLDAANHYLKTAWTARDVVGSYAGVRVLQRSDKASPSAVSRDWELKTAHNGVHYSIGGKLTSAREDASSIVNTVCAQLGRAEPCATKNRSFPWAPEQDYASWCEQVSARAAQLGVDAECAQWLIRRHGSRVEEVLRSVERDPQLAERIVATLPFVYADLLHCARAEMVMHLDDLLRRRMPLLILAQLGEQTLRRIAFSVAGILGWDEATMAGEMARCRAS